MAPGVSTDFEWRDGAAGRLLVCPPLESVARHLFSTRDLRYRGDAVGRDRARVAADLGAAPQDILSVCQVHGREVVAVTDASLASATCQADALVTTQVAPIVSVVVADCVPVLIGDRRRRGVAAVHAGWRGTAAGIVGATVERLRSMGIPSADLVVAIGPAIGPCCYQVDTPVRKAFDTLSPDSDSWFEPDGSEHWRLDLWRANRDQFVRAGVPPTAIYGAHLCTAHRADLYWSYRRDGATTGRMVAAITLRR